MVVRPFRPPGKNHQYHTYDGADQPEHQHRSPVQPEFEAHITTSFGMPWRYLPGPDRSLAFRERQLGPQGARRNYLGCIRIRRHRMLLKCMSIAGLVLQTYGP